jgi:glycolate oxidase FAD binding subunit
LIATNDSGPLRLRHGGIRDQLIGVTLVRADGVVVRGGGKVVKNVAGYDLPKLATGSLGTLGVIVEAIFRLYPLPDYSRTLLVQATSVEDACASMLELVDSPLAPSGLAIRWTGGPGCEVFLRSSGVTASVSAQSQQAEEIIAQLGLESRTLSATEADTAWRDLVEAPWSPAEQALVARVSVLPTEIKAVLLSLRGIAERADLQAKAVIYAHGLGVLRLEAAGSSGNGIVSATEELRQRISGRDGTLALLRIPLEAKPGLDVWGPEPDSLPLMRRIKTHLDPMDTLNPGRFVGGI